MPRNFDPRLNNLDNVFLYDIDDLEQVVEDHKGERQVEAVKAEAIVAEEVNKFWRWFVNQEVTPTIVALREQAELIRSREVEKTLAGLAELSPQAKEAVEALTRSLTNKLLHPPLAYLKQRHHNGVKREAEYVQETASPHVIRQIFGLDTHEE